MNYSIYNQTLSTEHYYPKLAAYYYRSKKSHHMPTHKHNRIEFMYVTNGYCSITTDSDTYTLKKGNLLFIDANLSHNLVIPDQDNCRMLNLEFTYSKTTNFLPSIKTLLVETDTFNLLYQAKKPVILITDSGILMDTIKAIITSKEKKSQYLKTQLLIYQFLIDFSTIYIESLSKASYDYYVTSVINFMLNHYDIPLTISEISGTINLNPNYLQRLFKKQTELTMMEYLNQIRLQRARKLLNSTTFSIQEISELVGYNSRQYFTSKFTHEFGISPAAYRKKNIPWSIIPESIEEI